MDSCQGDSGGPLMIQKQTYIREYSEQIGIVSFGLVCGTDGVPGVYTNVAYFMEWILNHLD